MEIEFEGTKLRVHTDGTIERWLFKKWKFVNGSNSHGYLNITINYKKYRIHRIIAMVYLGLDIKDTTQEIDHINRIKDDNRVENLRIVNSFENKWNVDHKGYHKHRTGWKAHIMTNGETKTKNFKNEAECIIWRNKMVEKYHVIST